MNNRLFYIVFVAFLLLPYPDVSADRNRMSMVDLINLPRVSSPVLSPDGQAVYFIRQDADWKKDRWIHHIWVKKPGQSAPIQLTNGPTGENNFTLSPGGDLVAFAAKRGDDKTKHLYLINPNGGEAFRLWAHPTDVSDLQWAPDGSGLYFLAQDSTKERDDLRKKRRDDLIRYGADTPKTQLWFVALSENTAERITDGQGSVVGFHVGPSKESGAGSILVSIAPSPALNDRNDAELYLLKNDGEAAIQLTDNNYLEKGFSLSPDGREILYLAQANEDGGGYYNANLFTLDLPKSKSDTRKAAQLLLANMPYGVNAAAFDQTAQTIFLLLNTGLSNRLFSYDRPSRKLSPLFSLNKASVGSWQYQRQSNKHSVILASPRNPGDIYRYEPGDKAPVPVTRIHADLGERYSLPRVEKIAWPGEDGTEVEGLLTYPVGYSEGNRYPLVVHTHGGPASSDQWGRFSTGRYTEVMAARGYAILQPNYRGSTGYGDAFLRDMIAANGGYFVNAHKDVMTGVDAVIELGIADPDRLIKMGWSAGGHMTNKIITHTDRFKAASSGAGAVNWFSMIGQSDIRDWRLAWFDQFPFEANASIDLYIRNSPLFDLHKVKTPTLILVGEKDVRVPAAQSLELYNALKKLGVPTAYYVAPGEPHGWRKLTHRLFKANIELDWFARFALETDYAFEKAPEQASPPL